MHPCTLVEGPQAWYAFEYRDDKSHSPYVYTLTPSDLKELDNAVRKIFIKWVIGKDEIQVNLRHLYGWTWQCRH